MTGWRRTALAVFGVVAGVWSLTASARLVVKAAAYGITPIVVATILTAGITTVFIVLIIHQMRRR